MSGPFYKLCIWVDVETQELLNTGECCGTPEKRQHLFEASPPWSKEMAEEKFNQLIERMKDEWKEICGSTGNNQKNASQKD